jgi:hypothetical protein
VLEISLEYPFSLDGDRARAQKSNVFSSGLTPSVNEFREL